MKFLGLSSALLILFLCTQANAVEAGVIAVPSMNVPNMDMPTPIPAPNMNTPEPIVKPLVKPNKNPIPVTNESANAISDQNQMNQKMKESTIRDVTGKWSIKFTSQPGRSIDLTLWPSSGNNLLGYGTLTESTESHSLTASGSILDKRLRLTTKSSMPEYNNKNLEEYYIDLLIGNNTSYGTYDLKSEGQSTERGNVTAIRH